MKALFLSVALFIGQNKQTLVDLRKTDRQVNCPEVVTIETLNDKAVRDLFLELQDEGTIVYEGEDEDTGMPMYTLFFEECTIEYAYEPEVLEFIKTGNFEYNDFLIENYQVIKTPQQ
jgi:hypothetical protein